MLLTVEYQAEVGELDIVCDGEGIDLLIDRLTKLRASGGGHTHLMTPSWAGDELTEERQNKDGSIINHVRLVLKHAHPVASASQGAGDAILRD